MLIHADFALLLPSFSDPPSPPIPRMGEVSFLSSIFTMPCQATAAVKTTQFAACHGRTTPCNCDSGSQLQASGKFTTQELRTVRASNTKRRTCGNGRRDLDVLLPVPMYFQPPCVRQTSPQLIQLVVTTFPLLPPSTQPQRRRRSRHGQP